MVRVAVPAFLIAFEGANFLSILAEAKAIPWTPSPFAAQYFWTSVRKHAVH